MTPLLESRKAPRDEVARLERVSGDAIIGQCRRGGMTQTAYKSAMFFASLSSLCC